MDIFFVYYFIEKRISSNVFISFCLEFRLNMIHSIYCCVCTLFTIKNQLHLSHAEKQLVVVGEIDRLDVNRRWLWRRLSLIRSQNSRRFIVLLNENSALITTQPTTRQRQQHTQNAMIIVSSLLFCYCFWTVRALILFTFLEISIRCGRWCHVNVIVKMLFRLHKTDCNACSRSFWFSH